MAPTNGIAKNPHCECEEDGYCQRYRRPMHGRMRQMCRGEEVDPGEAAKFRALWLSERDQQPAPRAEQLRCPHRTTEPIQENGQPKLRECPSCSGKVQLKVFGCDHPALAPHETTQQDCNACQYRPKPAPAKALILQNRLCPGDVLVMSAAIYSLHRANPGKFATAVDTTAMQLWEHNPDVVPADSLKDPMRLEVHYPLVNQSGQRGIHFMSAYCAYLEDALNVRVPLMTNRPMIYLSNAERSWMNQVEETTKRKQRFWLVNAGHKTDYPTKFWPWYQEVVDLLRGKITFVQIGEGGHVHKPLQGVISLVGKTDTRQVVRLAYHADGVLTGVSFPMHLASALEKPCVAIMGGREPVVWNSYPRQTLLHTVGALDCCRNAGCWKSRVVALNDNDPKDKSLCDAPLPDGSAGQCMALISPQTVVDAILRYQT